IQLEINKRLYMDEVTLERSAGFVPVQNTLRELTQALLHIDPRSASYED
ncbi:MAG: hypothetical protein RIS44_1625, partial [Pseudomonadota bacterium]